MASPTYQRRSSRLNKSSSFDETANPILTPSPLGRKSRLQSKSSESPTRYSSQGRETSPKQEQISENDLSDSNLSDDKGHATGETVVVKATHTQEINLSKRSPKVPSPITKESAIPSKGQPQTKSSSLISPVLLVCTLLALGLGLLLFVGCSKSQNPHPSSLPDQQEESLEMKLAKEINTMQRLFPLQSNETWLNFYAAFLGIMEEEPPQPSVLLLIGPNSSEGIETVQCIAERMARVTNHIFGSRKTSSVTVPVEESSIHKKKDEAFKKELDDRLHSVLKGSYAVVLERLEQIPPKAAMVLHGFCDNFVAPFKKKIIILTAAFNQDDQPVNSRQVDRQLRVMWDGELGADKSASLVSRVANSPLFIEPESGPATRCNLT